MCTNTDSLQRSGPHEARLAPGTLSASGPPLFWSAWLTSVTVSSIGDFALPTCQGIEQPGDVRLHVGNRNVHVLLHVVRSQDGLLSTALIAAPSTCSTS
jgi:hypothetical protein